MRIITHSVGLGKNWFYHEWNKRKRGLGPFFHVEQYGRRLYDTIGRTLSIICAIVFLMVLVGSILTVVVLGAINLWNYGHRLEHRNDVPKTESISVYAPDPCGLKDVYCPGEIQPRVGIASFLDYQLPDTCAARDWPKQTRLSVSANGRSIICVVRDYGPDARVHPDRIVDLNRNQFAQLESTRRGLIEVSVIPI